MAIIGVDLDNTLIKSNLMDITCKEFNISIPNHFSYSLTEFPTKVRNELFKRFNSNYFMCSPTVVSEIEGSSEKLLEWKKSNHKIILISARNKSIRKETDLLLKKLFPSFSKVMYVNMGEPKLPIFYREKLDYWVDDNPIDCRSAAEWKIKTYMISNDSTPYNWFMKNFRNLIVAKSVAEIKIQ